jgi:hypothetical protein
MGNPVILRHMESDRGTLGNGSWQATLPLANLRTQDIAEVARSTDALAASTQFRIDWGAGITRYADTFALIGTNLTFAATWRVALSNSATAATTVMDSGTITALPSTAVWGADPWGGTSWTGNALLDGVLPPGIALYRHPTAETARYLFVWITDTSNPAGHVQIGRFVAGPAFRPSRQFAYGATWRWIDPSERTRLPGGLRTLERRAPYRVFRGTLPYLPQQEARAFFGEWGRGGLNADALFIADPDAPAAEGQRRTMYCALNDTPEIPQSFFARCSVDLSLEELT